MNRDTTLFSLIKKEEKRQKEGIELIASENFVSQQVMDAMGSCLTNKYAEGYPGKRYYGGCGVVDEVEQLAIDRLCKIYNAEWANVQPHSGAQANMAVFLSVLKPGDTFMGLDLSHGGHLSHGSPVNSSGILYNAISYGLKEETGMIDYDAMEEIALRERPKMIIGGASAYSREWDYARMRKIADEIGAIFMVDMAHPAGLIAAGLPADTPVALAENASLPGSGHFFTRLDLLPLAARTALGDGPALILIGQALGRNEMSPYRTSQELYCKP